MEKQRFSAHIEGLRAFAVMPILLFHLDTRWCPGGFVGVDIFFVISGYLITRMILAEGTHFRFKTFYVRRFFRLFPALITTLILTLVAGWFVLGPSDYVRLSHSAISAVPALSNVYFLVTVDYFNASSVLHPLLHTWSLAVEEQFYLIWPAIIIFWFTRGLPLWLLLTCVSIISFVAMMWAWPTMPEAAFYLMPFRIFEFGFGACLLLLESRWQSLRADVQAAAGLIGGLLLAVSFVVIDEVTPWPGVWTLLPAAATGLLILAGGTGICAKVLENPVPRFLGRISYSLYLVHWPLITLYRAHSITEPTPIELMGLGIAAVALGSTFFVAVESTFWKSSVRVRRSGTGKLRTTIPLREFSPGTKAAVIGGLTFVVIAGGGAISAKDGFPSRLSSGQVQNLDKGLTFAGDLCSFRRDRCAFGDLSATTTIYLVGDSLALNWVYGLDQLFRDNKIKGIALYDHGCLFVYKTKRFKRGAPDERCRKSIEEAYSLLTQNRYPVIFSGDWMGYLNSIGDAHADVPLRQKAPEYFSYLERNLILGLEQIGADERTIFLVNQPYSTGGNIAQCLSQPLGDESSRNLRCAAQSRTQATSQTAVADRMISRVAQRFSSIVTIDPKAVFCREEVCEVSGNRGLYFRDASHLTNEGSQFMVAGFRDRILRAIALEQ